MNTEILKRLLAFVLLCLVQALILNRIRLFGFATPLLPVYFVITFHRGYPKWAILIWSFLLGLCLDSFSNTPGVAAASMTLVALLQPYLLEPFVPRDSTDDLKVSVRSLGWGKFASLSFLLVVVYVAVFFTLEAFSFYNWQQWLMCIGGSTAMTYLFILVIENLRSK
ncbi:MAG: rod shape-determining protein MreD [Prevotella sp.]|nr:rod shape-determining protein MreD [Prevotella sp.]MBR5391866.1 rod shape-determining protein MreD [Prevotella sp.]